MEYSENFLLKQDTVRAKSNSPYIKQKWHDNRICRFKFTFPIHDNIFYFFDILLCCFEGFWIFNTSFHWKTLGLFLYFHSWPKYEKTQKIGKMKRVSNKLLCNSVGDFIGEHKKFVGVVAHIQKKKKKHRNNIEKTFESNSLKILN